MRSPTEGTSEGATNRKIAAGSTKRRISQGQAIRSTFGLARVTQRVVVDRLLALSSDPANAAASVEITYKTGGKQAVLPKPKMINRMPGSALYTHFLVDPARPGSLTFLTGGNGADSIAGGWSWSRRTAVTRASPTGARTCACTPGSR